MWGGSSRPASDGLVLLYMVPLRFTNTVCNYAHMEPIEHCIFSA